MISAADLSRDELELLLPHRLPESAILAAKAQVARRKADRLRAAWREQSEIVTRHARRAKELGERDKWRGPDFAEALSAAHAWRGLAADAERLYIRAEKEAQALERAHRRAMREEERQS